ncbi:hypothetical protein BpHYR1_033697 [Brachionus plicatilis]|uniref:Uncharacterized protein n=1 Tax=Brachionus plicatilis TaxID=10195 RepID=A0A3M7SL19_BRAPC|nr:hypothetical protein BpHYR1_033697 [Brachionus plicatilis]
MKILSTKLSVEFDSSKINLSKISSSKITSSRKIYSCILLTTDVRLRCSPKIITSEVLVNIREYCYVVTNMFSMNKKINL